MPMNTTFVSRCGVVSGSLAASRLAHSTWAAISPAVRLFCRPICPVAQNVHPIAHPACDETQTVTRSRVAHEHRLDHVLAPELQQRLAGRAAVRCPFVEHLDAERELAREPLAEGRRDVGHLVVGRAALPELGPDLLRPERRLVPRHEPLAQLLLGHVVHRRHDPA